MNLSNSKSFAVVTGASSGIGFELARQFADHGFDLLICSDTSRIEEAAQSLRNGDTQVETLQVDLSTYQGVEDLYAAIRANSKTVDALAINAGVGVSGDFVRSTDLQDEIKMINLNVVAPVHLAKLVLKDMVRAGRGRILFTSSIAGTMPTPFYACYGASKAFLTSFAQGIRNEIKDTGVSITVLMPGATDTEFFERAGMQDTKVGQSEKDSPADVARDGFKALMAGEDHIVGGSFKNKLQAAVGHLLPDTTMAEIHRKQTEPGSGQR